MSAKFCGKVFLESKQISFPLVSLVRVQGCSVSRRSAPPPTQRSRGRPESPHWLVEEMVSFRRHTAIEFFLSHKSL